MVNVNNKYFMNIINKAKPIILLMVVFIMTLAIGLQGSTNEANAENVCADCEMNNTCVVTCRDNPDGSQTPICGNYGDQPCDCGPPVIISE
tara:strand:- start:15896 stop:16168 length:273 start_codon:yes stop_codon:yes gene_type:complete